MLKLNPQLINGWMRLECDDNKAIWYDSNFHSFMDLYCALRGRVEHGHELFQNESSLECLSCKKKYRLT